jgi:hypothetical protein
MTLIDFTPEECRRRVARMITRAIPEQNPERRRALLEVADRCADFLRARRSGIPREPRSFADD